jgi:putative Mg2+ transporter-C (MgtC) family protein
MENVLIKLAVAAICGLALGLERESKHKPLGLKTCVVISVASCLLTIVSIEAAISSYNGTELLRADPMRLAAQIVSGIGFLGAGVILHKSNDAISGLTTAAIVWAASGLGITIGAGYYFEGISGMVLIFLGVKVLPFILKKIGPRALRELGVKINIYVHSDVNIKEVIHFLLEQGINIRNVRILGKADGHKLELNCTIKEEKNGVFSCYERVRRLNVIDRLEIEVL